MRPSLTAVVLSACSCCLAAACVVQSQPTAAPAAEATPPPSQGVSPRETESQAATTPPPAAPPPSTSPQGPVLVAADARAAEMRAMETARGELSKRRVTLYNARHKDGRQVYPSEGYMVPVAPVASGFLFSGLRDKGGATTVVIGKYRADWQLQWELVYEKKGFAAYEGGQVVEDPDGNVLAVVPSYPDPSRNPTLRFAKLSSDGKIIWELQLPRDKWGNSAQVHLGKVAADGSLELAGHIYQGPPPAKGDRPALRWTATITRDGVLTSERIGAPIDWARDDW